MTGAQKIGVFGGTFDPLHAGHLQAAHQVLQKMALDKIYFTPTNIPVFKQEQKVSDAALRLDELKQALNEYPQFEVSDYDIKRGGVTYTIDTLKDFARDFPNDQLYFIAGADVLPSLEQWKDIKKALEIAKFIIVTRPGFTLEVPAFFASDEVLGRLQLLEIDAVDLSSTQLREQISS